VIEVYPVGSVQIVNLIAEILWAVYLLHPHCCVKKFRIVFTSLQEGKRPCVCWWARERVPSLLQCYGDGWPTQLLHAPINWQMFPTCVFPLHIAEDPLYSICSELTVQTVMSQNSIFGQWFVPQWRFLEHFSTPSCRNVLEQHCPSCRGVDSDCWKLCRLTERMEGRYGRVARFCIPSYTGLFEMTVGVLTTCHTQYTWDSSIFFFYLIEQHSKFLLHTLQVLYMWNLCDSTNINTIIEFVPNCL